MINDIDRMLDSLRDEYAERDQREADERTRRDQALVRAQSQAQQAQRERDRAAMLDRARHYLATLVAESKEGRWFDDFARHYATREDAAIEVIRAQDELERVL